MRTPKELLERTRGINNWLVEQKRLHASEHARIGTEAEKVRNAAGISLRGLAQIMGCTAPFIADLEHGRRCWTTETMEKWHAAILSQNI